MEGTSCSVQSFVVPHKLEAGHCGSGGRFLRGAWSFSTDTAETAPSIIHQLSQPEAEVRTNPCQKKRPHLTMHFRSGGTESAGDSVKRLRSHSIVLHCDWLSRWEGLIWPLQRPRPLVTWVGPPTSITQLSVSNDKTDLSGKLSGELTRKALGRQLDVALCHDWHRFLLHAALWMTFVAV